MKIEWFGLVDAACIDICVTETEARVALRNAAPWERAVDLVRRGEEQHWRRTRAATSDRLEDVVCAVEIDLEVLAGIEKGARDRRLRGEMEHDLYVGLAHNRPNRVRVANV